MTIQTLRYDPDADLSGAFTPEIMQEAEARAIVFNADFLNRGMGASGGRVEGLAEILNLPTSINRVSLPFEEIYRYPPVICAVRLLAESLASLPIRLFEVDNDGKNPAEKKTPWVKKLNCYPNEEITGFQFRKNMFVDLFKWGRGMAYIRRNKMGDPIELWPMEACQTWIKRRGGRTFYKYGGKEYPAKDVIDIPFLLGDDHLSHLYPISLLEEHVGAAVLSLRDRGKAYGEGGMPRTVIMDKIYDESAAANMRQAFLKGMKTSHNSNSGIMVMPEGADVLQLKRDVMPEITTELAAVEQVARVYNIPPMLLHDLRHGTYANFEQQSLNFRKSLKSWAAVLEQQLVLKLIPEHIRHRYYYAVDVDAISGADLATRMKAFQTAINSGVKTPNEVREEEGLPPKEGGYDIFVQGALRPAKEPYNKAATPSEGDKPDDDGMDDDPDETDDEDKEDDDATDE